VCGCEPFTASGPQRIGAEGEVGRDAAADFTVDVQGSAAPRHRSGPASNMTTTLIRTHGHQRTYPDPGGAMSIVDGALIRLRVSRLPGRQPAAQDLGQYPPSVPRTHSHEEPAAES
jgi:hypothetical protein